ncbi:MAG: hypothetical protein LC723_13695, partial [Actinobacteria bacterium]|nr:hypothetical protein [Actinomycetota bacterium]
SYTVQLAAQPNCGGAITLANCKVYVTISAAYPPQSEHRRFILSTIPDGLPVGTDGDTFNVSGSLATNSPADFLRQITLNGSLQDVEKRSIVLVFDATTGILGQSWNKAQTVYLYAVDDTLAEGTRIVTSSHTVIQTTCDASDAKRCFDGAVVRNVEATVYDNDQPDIILVQVDPNTLSADNNTVALEGFGVATATNPITEQIDKYTIQLANAPGVGNTVSVQIALSDLPGDMRVCLDSSDPRFSHTGAAFADPTNCPAGGTTYFAKFTNSDWFMPVLINIHARNDSAPADPHNTSLTHTIVDIVGHPTTGAYLTAAPTIQQRIDAFVIDDENPGVFVLESDGSTLVSACGNADCTIPGLGDTYQLRLNSAPTALVKVAIITDGQTDVDMTAVDPSRVKLEQVGGLQASQAFKGNITISGTASAPTFTRANGSDLGSFLDEGFQLGQRIRLSGTGTSSDGDYVITNLDALTLTLQPASAVPGGTPGSAVNGTYNTVLISQLVDKGVYVGSVAYNATDNTLIRVDGSSWLDSGFLEGQLIKITGFAGPGCVDGPPADGTCIFKIQLISGTGPGKTDKATLTSAPAAAPTPPTIHPDTLPGTGTALLTVLQWAAVAYFNAPNANNAANTCPPASCGDWYQPITIPLIADPFFQLASGRENLKMFPKQRHLLSGIRGPLAVEGGTTASDRSLKAAVLLPGEGNGPVFRVAAQPPEWQSIDTLNVYDDGSAEDLTGQLTSTALTGLNMGPALDFSFLLCTNPADKTTCKHPFSEPGVYPGGISYGSISLDSNGTFIIDGTLSTVEVVNIMMGAGNDHLNIQSTLQPGGDFNPITGMRGELAHHGGITAVHAGGNALQKVKGNFETAAGQITRKDGLAWTKYGFAIGQQVTLPNGSSYTVTGFAPAGIYGTGDTMLIAGGPALSAGTLSGVVAVSDYLQVTGRLIFSGNGISLTNGQAWKSLGYAVGQQVYVTGVGVRNVVGFNNDPINGDGAVLLIDGASLGAPLTVNDATVSVASRNRVAGALALVGSADGGTITVSSPTFGSVAGSGLTVGQQVVISTIADIRTISAITGNVITVTGGAIATTSGAGTIALAGIGGDSVKLTGPSISGSFNTTPSKLVRTDAGSFITDGFAVGQQVILTGGLAGAFNVTGVTTTALTLTGVNGSTLVTQTAVAAVATVLPTGAGPGQPSDIYSPLVVYGDTSQDGVWYGGDPHTLSLHNFGPKPMPHVESVNVTLSETADGKTATIALNSITGSTSTGSFLSDGFAVAQELALGPISGVSMTALFDIFSNHLTLHSGTWTGFAVGQVVTIGSIPGTWSVISVSGPVLQLNGPTLTPLPNQTLTVTAISTYVGIVKAVTATSITLNLALSIPDHPEGPQFPVAAGGTTSNVIRNITVLNRVGNSAPFFIFPLANPFQYSGNDVVDAHLLDWSDNPSALRSIGLTVYGGSGNDTIIGSQTGDQMAGGSGDDTILGQRGQDHIYGDSGFNVDLITRALTVAVIGTG